MNRKYKVVTKQVQLSKEGYYNYYKIAKRFLWVFYIELKENYSSITTAASICFDLNKKI